MTTVVRPPGGPSRHGSGSPARDGVLGGSSTAAARARIRARALGLPLPSPQPVRSPSGRRAGSPPAGRSTRPVEPAEARKPAKAGKSGKAAKSVRALKSGRPINPAKPAKAIKAIKPAKTIPLGRRSASREPSRRAPRRLARRELPAADSRRRLLVLLVALTALFGIIAWKIADLQIINPTHYLAFGQSQTVRSETLAAERGTIYDRNHAPLAMSVPERTIFADPKLVTDPRGEAEQLGPILGLDVAELEHRLSTPNRFTYLARKVDPAIADKVAALSLPGIAFIDESQRTTPSGDLAKSLIGSVDVDNKGLSGLEAKYADQLTGTPGSLTLEQTPSGHTIQVGEHQLTPAKKGDDLVLTIDQAMQYQTEEILADQVATAEAKGGIAIVTRPSTGEVLAMADVVRDATTGKVTTSGNNAALTTVYEPGSVMKIATVSAAIERGLVTPDTKVDVPGSLQVGDATFTDAEAHATEQLTVAQIVSQSSNIGTIEIGQKLGKQGIYDALTGLGFGTRTAIDFPNEAAGVVLQPGKWSGTSIGTIPIGQGVSATPLQVLDAYNVVANGGMAVAPRLVDSTIDADGREHPVSVDAGHRVLSADTAAKMNLMLRNVVTQGTGTLAQVDGYHVAGKTGTARKPQPGGGYTDASGATHYQSTFVGMVPAESPALSVIVVIDEPSGGNYFGGAVAAPAFAKIASYGLRQFAIPPPQTDVATGGAATGTQVVSGIANTGVQTMPDGKIRAAAATPVTIPASPAAPPAKTVAPAKSTATTTVPKKTKPVAPTTTPTTRPK